MSCCAGGPALADPRPPPAANEAGPAAKIELIVPNAHCAACMASIETAVAAIPGARSARLNLSIRRLTVLHDGRLDAETVMAAVEAAGYACRVFDSAMAGASADDIAGRELLRSLAIAGFAAANIMLLSVSIWSGAADTTRELFHWLSALIALPAVVLAGRPFYRSAFGALRRGRLNMDVPISLAVVLAAGLSLKVAVEGDDAAFFDAAVTLLFFLLIGRYLDHRTRARARDAVSRLLSLWSDNATRYGPEGPERVAVSDIAVGDRLLIAVGDRAPVDAVIEAGVAELDCSALTGESDPRLVRPGDELLSGALALSGPITVRAVATSSNSYIAEAVRLMEEAESGRARYVRLADRAARIYAPAVHLIAFGAFLFQFWLSGDWSHALWVAVSVLIITCPCALGLAVPAVHTVASGTLFRRGVLMKDGAALERLADIDGAVFDKTGTLTTGTPRVLACAAEPEALALAGALARSSRHPLAVALARHAEAPPFPVTDVTETAGAGITGLVDGRRVMLGSRAFTGATSSNDDGSEVWIKVEAATPARVEFEDAPRQGAAALIQRFTERGLKPTILSGDREPAVRSFAQTVGVTSWRAGQTPADKIAFLNGQKAEGLRQLMVGDGVNDGPALAAAHVSMAPASASDIGSAAADFVIVGDDLLAVEFTLEIAKKAKRLVLQNFGIAGLYNAIAIPIAVLGYASPLAAAAAMSTSSILVTVNALRLAAAYRRGEARAQSQSYREATA